MRWLYRGCSPTEYFTRMCALLAPTCRPPSQAGASVKFPAHASPGTMWQCHNVTLPLRHCHMVPGLVVRAARPFLSPPFPSCCYRAGLWGGRETIEVACPQISHSPKTLADAGFQGIVLTIPRSLTNLRRPHRTALISCSARCRASSHSPSWRSWSPVKVGLNFPVVPYSSTTSEEQGEPSQLSDVPLQHL